MQGETLSVAEAASRLGVNEKTIRRWVKAGRLSAELEPGPYGQQYRIPVDALQTAQQALAVVTVERGADPQALALAIVQALEPRDAAIRAEVEALRGELGALRVLLDERLPLPVQGPQQGGESPLSTPDQLPAPMPPPNASPWWRHRLAPHVAAIVTVLVMLVVLVVAPAWVR